MDSRSCRWRAESGPPPRYCASSTVTTRAVAVRTRKRRSSVSTAERMSWWTYLVTTSAQACSSTSPAGTPADVVDASTAVQSRGSPPVRRWRPSRTASDGSCPAQPNSSRKSSGVYRRSSARSESWSGGKVSGSSKVDRPTTVARTSTARCSSTNSWIRRSRIGSPSRSTRSRTMSSGSAGPVGARETCVQ